MSELCCII